MPPGQQAGTWQLASCRAILRGLDNDLRARADVAEDERERAALRSSLEDVSEMLDLLSARIEAVHSRDGSH